MGFTFSQETNIFKGSGEKTLYILHHIYSITLHYLYSITIYLIINKKYTCRGPPAFKSQKVGHQCNQKLPHHYQH